MPSLFSALSAVLSLVASSAFAAPSVPPTPTPVPISSPAPTPTSNSALGNLANTSGASSSVIASSGASPSVARPSVSSPSATSSPGVSNPYASSTRGYDISYPQCGERLPSGSNSFAVIGVNGGRAFTQNPCFIAEYDSSAATAKDSVYMNINAPIGPTASQHIGDPSTCGTSDQLCQAHNYGWNAGQYALTLAGNRSSATWWLDVETENSWADRTDVNRATIQGAFDYLTSHGIAHVGVYSTQYMWNLITGTWANNWPVWYAGVKTTDCAFAKSHSFTHGEVWLLQKVSAASGGNIAC